MRMEYREQRQRKIHTENMKKIGQEQQKISPKIGLDFKLCVKLFLSNLMAHFCKSF